MLSQWLQWVVQKMGISQLNLSRKCQTSRCDDVWSKQIGLQVVKWYRIQCLDSKICIPVLRYVFIWRISKKDNILSPHAIPLVSSWTICCFLAWVFSCGSDRAFRVVNEVDGDKSKLHQCIHLLWLSLSQHFCIFVYSFHSCQIVCLYTSHMADNNSRQYFAQCSLPYHSLLSSTWYRRIVLTRNRHCHHTADSYLRKLRVGMASVQTWDVVDKKALHTLWSRTTHQTRKPLRRWLFTQFRQHSLVTWVHDSFALVKFHAVLIIFLVVLVAFVILLVTLVVLVVFLVVLAVFLILCVRSNAVEKWHNQISIEVTCIAFTTRAAIPPRALLSPRLSVSGAPFFASA